MNQPGRDDGRRARHVARRRMLTMYHRSSPLGQAAVKDCTNVGRSAQRELYGLRRLVQAKPALGPWRLYPGAGTPAAQGMQRQTRGLLAVSRHAFFSLEGMERNRRRVACRGCPTERECRSVYSTKFQDVTTITLRTSLQSLRLNLWDEDQQRMVSFGHVRVPRQTQSQRDDGWQVIGGRFSGVRRSGSDSRLSIP